MVFTRRVSLSLLLMSSYTLHLFFRPDEGTSLPSIRFQGSDALYVAQISYSPGSPSPSPWWFPFLLCSLLGMQILTLLLFSHLLHDFVCIFLYTLSCRRVFLHFSRLLSVRITLHVDVFLMCSYGEVSSASSYFTILISSLFILNVGTYWYKFSSQNFIWCIP